MSGLAWAMDFLLGFLLVVCGGMGWWLIRLGTRLRKAHAEYQLLSGRLRQLEREHKLIVDNELVGAVRLRDRTAVWHNRALALMLGYEPRELVGQSSRIVYPSDEVFEDVGRRAYPVLESGRTYRTLVQLRRKNGSLIWVDMSGTPLDDKHRDTLWLLLDITEMKQHHARVASLAFHDALTGLPNRRLLEDRVEHAIAVAERESQWLAVAYLDLDGFKPVNDSHGHEAGDQLLKVVAKRLQASVRTSDTVARLGGDEFVMLLRVEHLDEALHVLRRALRAVALPVSLANDAVVTVSGSVGVALGPQHASQPHTLLAMADRAMYEAKHEGRGGICVFDPARMAVSSRFAETGPR